jgi:hypothetical protein
MGSIRNIIPRHHAVYSIDATHCLWRGPGTREILRSTEYSPPLFFLKFTFQRPQKVTFEIGYFTRAPILHICGNYSVLSLYLQDLELRVGIRPTWTPILVLHICEDRENEISSQHPPAMAALA